MTENEAIAKLEEIWCCAGSKLSQKESLAIDMGKYALMELQEYHAIGTADECRETMKKQKANKIIFKAKRIDNGEWVEGYYAFDGHRHYIITKIKDVNNAIYGHFSNDVELYVVDPDTVCEEANIFNHYGDRNKMHEHKGLKSVANATNEKNND